MEEITLEQLKECDTFVDMSRLLEHSGRVQHVNYNEDKAWELEEKEPDRLFNVGTCFYDGDPSDKAYRKGCIQDALFLYSSFPLIFEFCDELKNDIHYENEGPTLVMK